MKEVKKYKHEIYSKISHAQRILVIYLKTVHSLTLKDIELASKVKYNTIRNILRAYKRCGRTNKKAYKKQKPAEANRPNCGKCTLSSSGRAQNPLSKLGSQINRALQGPDINSPLAKIVQKRLQDSRTVIQELSKCDCSSTSSHSLQLPAPRCPLRLEVVTSGPASTLEKVKMGAPTSQDQYLSEGLCLFRQTAPELEQERAGVQSEVIVSQIGEFENEKANGEYFLTGSLSFMNKYIRESGGRSKLAQLPSVEESKMLP